MATTTSPDNIFVLETSDNDTPSSWQPAMATSVQNALTDRALHTYRWANATERAAQTGMDEGDLGDQADTDTIYRYDGSAWVIVWAPMPWVAWTPTLQNFASLGTGGAATGAYRNNNGVCEGWLDVTLGAGASAASSWGFNMPLPIRTALNGRSRKIGDALFRDASVSAGSAAGHADLIVMFSQPDGYAQFRQPYSGSSGVTDYGYLSQTQGGLPSFASGDYLTAKFSYPV